MRTRPPGIALKPALRDIAGSPYVDPDPDPPGARLVFYRVHRPGSDADPGYDAIALIKASPGVAVHWSGGGC